MRKQIVQEKKSQGTRPLSSTIGSIRTRLTSDKEKRGERRSNESININRFKKNKIDKAMKRSKERKDRINLSEVHLKMRIRGQRLSGPPYNKERKFRESFLLVLPCETKARAEEGGKLDYQDTGRRGAILHPDKSKTSGLLPKQKLQQGTNKLTPKSPIGQDISITKCW